jgi:hypothetical protein
MERQKNYHNKLGELEMSNITGQMNPDLTITNMSANMILRLDKDGTIWAKISRPIFSVPPSLQTGTVYIGGFKYTVSSFEFVKIFN